MGEGVFILLLGIHCVGSLVEFSREEMEEVCTRFCPLAALADLDLRILFIVLAEGTWEVDCVKYW